MTNENSLGEEGLNATQLDAQRARHLLDRALGLSERGDIAGAIVVCRQSLALAPLLPQGWSMLGLLCEQDGEIDSAIAAYEKVLELSPGSIVERESLQRLRQQRGPVPRPAPAFHFDGDSLAVPAAPAAAAQSASIDSPNSVTWWNLFYFRSLPLMAAAVVCLLILVGAQRLAFRNRHANRVKNTTSLPAVKPAAETTPPAPSASTLPPSALAPRGTVTAPPDTAAPETPQSSTTPKAPTVAPHIAPKPAAKPKPSPRPKPRAKPPAKPRTPARPRASDNSEMPVLPRPRITLPQRTAPAQPPRNNPPANNEAPKDNQEIGGGPVDVGDSDSGKYIPINPPAFPNPSRG